MRSPVYQPRVFPSGIGANTNKPSPYYVSYTERKGINTHVLVPMCENLENNWDSFRTKQCGRQFSIEEILDSSALVADTSGLVWGEGDLETWNLCCCLQRPSFYGLFLQDLCPLNVLYHFTLNDPRPWANIKLNFVYKFSYSLLWKFRHIIGLAYHRNW